MLPEQERLPVSIRSGREHAPGGERGRGETKCLSARSCHSGPPDGDSKVRADEQRDRASDRDVQLSPGDQDAPEHVRLAKLVEPQSIGAQASRSVGEKDRYAHDDQDDGCAATGTKPEWPPPRRAGRSERVVRTLVSDRGKGLADRWRLGRRGDLDDFSGLFECCVGPRSLPSVPVQAPMLR